MIAPGVLRFTRPLLLVTDVGFLLYWTVTALALIPASLAFEDASDPLLVAWNWSFLPLDLLVTALGFTALWLARRRHPLARGVLTVALALTFCAGLQAVSFWAIRGDFDLMWWLPNLFLMIYPPPILYGLWRRAALD